MDKANILLRFLKENDIYNIELRKTILKHRKFSESYILSFFRTSFVWLNTNEGYEFWYHIALNFFVFIIDNGFIENFDKKRFLSSI